MAGEKVCGLMHGLPPGVRFKAAPEWLLVPLLRESLQPNAAQNSGQAVILCPSLGPLPGVHNARCTGHHGQAAQQVPCVCQHVT